MSNPDQPIDGGTTYNYRAVDDLIAHVSKKHAAEESNWSAKTWTFYAAWGAVLIASIGLCAFLIMWGYSLIIEKPEPKIIEVERIIEKPIQLNPTVVVQTPAGTGSGSADVARSEAQRRIEAVQGDSASPANTVYNYVIFKDIPFTEGGFDTVTVGMQFSTSESVHPDYQWCYIAKGAGALSVSKRVSLAEKGPSGSFNYPIDYSTAVEAGVALGILQRAQRKCSFE